MKKKGYTKTMLKTDQNNPVVKEYVDAMKRGKMNDLKPFVHGQEGSHYSCDEQLRDLGGKAMCCGCTGHKCNPNPTEKSMIQKKKITLHKTKEYATDVIPTPTVESWRKELKDKYTSTWDPSGGENPITFVDSPIEDIEQFISSQIQQAEERLVEKIKKEYNKRYQKIAKEHGLKRKTPHTMFHDVLATLKEEKDL